MCKFQDYSARIAGRPVRLCSVYDNSDAGVQAILHEDDYAVYSYDHEHWGNIPRVKSKITYNYWNIVGL